MFLLLVEAIGLNLDYPLLIFLIFVHFGLSQKFFPPKTSVEMEIATSSTCCRTMHILDTFDFYALASYEFIRVLPLHICFNN